MNRSRQTFKNTTSDEIFVTVEPWCWRYRLKPGDVLEILYASKCVQAGWAPFEIHVGMEGDKVGLFVHVNGNSDPEMLVNGLVAVEDYDLR